MIASVPSLGGAGSQPKAKPDRDGSNLARLLSAIDLILMLSTPFLFWSAVAFLVWWTI